MAEEATFDFDQSFQLKLAALFVRDANFAMQTKDILKPEYFTEDAAAALVRLTHKHIQTYRTVPDMRLFGTILKEEFDNKRLRDDMRKPIKETIASILRADLSNPDFVKDKLVDFARTQALIAAMEKSIPLIDKRDWSKIESYMKDALSVGANSDDGGGYDYFAEIEGRTKVREALKAGAIVRNGITTGYPVLDAHMYHYGWGRKELSCMMGPAKSGKSMSLGDFGKNAALAGFNVLYDSLEVAKEIIAERTDAALSDTMVKNLHKDPATVEAAIKAAHAKAGRFELRDHPSGTLKPSALHRLIERYRSDGIIFDLIIVDYADIMAAEYRSDSLQENLRSIYVDLRALAHETNAAFLTATQTNRDGAKAATAKATDVGDDWNKARTVDLMIGINATDAEKAIGQARLSWLLSRNTEDGFSLRIEQDRQKMQFLKKVLGRV